MKFIIGNWKMNGTRRDKEKMINALSKIRTKNKIILALPFTLLWGNNKNIAIAAQNISEHDNGAYTGDISGKMLTDAGVKYVIVGHSERRTYHNETDEIIHDKAITAIKNKISPIICIGETLNEYKSGKTNGTIKKMLKQVLPTTGKFMIAYEPRWAIGTGKTPTMKEIESVHKTIFEYLASQGFDKTPIIYGGSVNSTNASEIAKIKHVDGLLVGGASLESKNFITIIKSVK